MNYVLVKQNWPETNEWRGSASDLGVMDKQEHLLRRLGQHPAG